MLKRLLLLAAVVLLSFVSVSAQKVKIQGVSSQSNVVVTAGINSTTRALRTFPSSTITIYNQGTLTLATLWTDAAGTVPKANPFTASASDASWFAYVDAGRYDVTFSGVGIATPFTISDITAGSSASSAGSFTPTCTGTNDTTAFSTILTTIGANTGTIMLPYVAGSRCAVNNLTIPANVTLDNSQGTGIKVNTGQTLTILGPIVSPVKQTFYNALAGQGTVAITSYGTQMVYPEWWGASPTASAAVNTPAIQAAWIGAYGNDRTNPSGNYKYNRILFFSGGTYQINDEIIVIHANGFNIQGETKLGTVIQQTATNKRIINADGIAYGAVSNISFATNASQNVPLIELDWTGAQTADLRPQNITFQDVYFQGIYTCFAAVRIAKSGGGSQGDNVRFKNCYINGFYNGAIIGDPNAYAYNAIHVSWNDGDIQSCSVYGLAAYGGSWQVHQATFENGVLTQTGYDVYCEGNQNPCLLEDIRSESLRLFSGTSFNINRVEQVQQGYTSWFLAGGAVALDTLITGTAAGGDGGYYKVTTAGVLGGTGQRTATAGGATSITDSTASFVNNAFVGYRVSIMNNTGARQYGIVTGNTNTVITVAAGWVTDYSQSITNPAAGSVFVVEPNWNQGVITDGTAVLTFIDFMSGTGAVPVSGAGAVANANISHSKFIGGKVNAIGHFDDVTFTRSDWAYGPGGNLIRLSLGGYPANVSLRDTRVIRPNGESGDLVLWSLPRATNTPYSDWSQFQLGSQPLVWSEGNGSVDAPDLVLRRNVAQGSLLQLATNTGGSPVGFLGTKYCFSTTVCAFFGTGTPEGAVTAGIGSTFHRTDGGASTSFYVKESGSGNTGWVAK